MSINNSNNDKIKYYCSHTEQLNKNIILNKPYFFCNKCNHIILLNNKKTYSLYNYIPNEEYEDQINNLQMDFDPIITVRNMLKRQKEQIKYINDKLVLNFSRNYVDETNKSFCENKNNEYITEKIYEITNDYNDNIYQEEEKLKRLKRVDSEIINKDDSTDKKRGSKFPVLLFDEENFEKYCSQRNKILVYIHKLCSKLKYNDNSFYITLYLADTYLSKIFSDDISEKELFLVILGFFLISSKYIEDDIFEPEFQTFCNLEKNIEALSMDEIRTSEVQCLTLINHNLYIYSVYDWINVFLNNGIIFQDEIRDINGLDKLYIYTQKLLTLITSKIYFCRYSSIQIALSIIQISREKFANENLKLSKKLYQLLLSLYGIEFFDYEECYNIIKLDISESDEMDEEEEDEDYQEESSNSNSKINIRTIKNINSQKINEQIKTCKTLNKERNKYKFDKISNKNKNRISVDSNNGYIKTDVNLIKNNNSTNGQYFISSLDNKKDDFSKDKYKLMKNNYNITQNNSIEIMEKYNTNKKLTPNMIEYTNNTSLNNTSIKSFNLNSNNLKVNSNKQRDRNLFLNKKNLKSNTLHINYAPKFLIKNIGPIINNINYINNVSITHGELNLYSGSGNTLKNNEYQNNIKTNSNINYGIKKNNKNDEIRNNTNHVLRKALYNLENKIPIQLNYEYNINSISNNKIKNENNIKKLENNNVQNKIRNNLKNTDNKEKFKSHLLLEFTKNSILNNIQLNNNKASLDNKDTKSLNKYTANEFNKNLNKKMKYFYKNKNEVKILNTNINIDLNNNNAKSRKITLNVRDIIDKKLNFEHINRFLMNNNIKNNNKRFKSLYTNNNIFSKEKLKNFEKKYIIFSNENKHNNNENKKSVNSRDNNYINKNEFEKNKKNIILIYKNSFRQQLPKLRVNRKSLLTN